MSCSSRRLALSTCSAPPRRISRSRLFERIAGKGGERTQRPQDECGTKRKIEAIGKKQTECRLGFSSGFPCFAFTLQTTFCFLCGPQERGQELYLCQEILDAFLVCVTGEGLESGRVSGRVSSECVCLWSLKFSPLGAALVGSERGILLVLLLMLWIVTWIPFFIGFFRGTYAVGGGWERSSGERKLVDKKGRSRGVFGGQEHHM